MLCSANRHFIGFSAVFPLSYHASNPIPTANHSFIAFIIAMLCFNIQLSFSVFFITPNAICSTTFFDISDDEAVHPFFIYRTLYQFSSFLFVLESGKVIFFIRLAVTASQPFFNRVGVSRT